MPSQVWVKQGRKFLSVTLRNQSLARVGLASASKGTFKIFNLLKEFALLCFGDAWGSCGRGTFPLLPCIHPHDP